MTATTVSHRDSKNPVPIPVADAIDSISNFRRRQVILLTADAETTTADDLAVRIAATENDCSTNQLSAQQRKRVYISLTQTHLKRLARTGVIHYDETSKVVTSTTATAPLADCIRGLHEMCCPCRN